MKTLSRWAANHPQKARFIIVIAHLIVALIAILLGFMSYLENIRMPAEMSIVLLMVFGVAALFYPRIGRKTGLWKHSYTRQKSHDFILVISSAFMLMCGVNSELFRPMQGLEMTLPKAQPKAQFMSLNTANGHSDYSFDQKRGERKYRKSLRKSLKKQARLFKQQQKRNTTTGFMLMKILATTLIVALSLVGGYYIAILSCSLSCSGSGGLATIVFIFGSLGIGAIGIMFLQFIWRK